MTKDELVLAGILDSINKSIEGLTRIVEMTNDRISLIEARVALSKKDEYTLAEESRFWEGVDYGRKTHEKGSMFNPVTEDDLPYTSTSYGPVWFAVRGDGSLARSETPQAVQSFEEGVGDLTPRDAEIVRDLWEIDDPDPPPSAA